MDIASKLDTIFSDSLFKDEEIIGGTPPDNAVIVDGILGRYGFHPDRLASHKPEIAELIREMPDTFMAGGDGGGWSFLQLCNDKNGRQWGEHRNMEQLVVLAIGTEQGQYLLPREVWSALPGGMPYVAFSPTA